MLKESAVGKREDNFETVIGEGRDEGSVAMKCLGVTSCNPPI